MVRVCASRRGVGSRSVRQRAGKRALIIINDDAIVNADSNDLGGTQNTQLVVRRVCQWRPRARGLIDIIVLHQARGQNGSLHLVAVTIDKQPT